MRQTQALSNYKLKSYQRTNARLVMRQTQALSNYILKSYQRTNASFVMRQTQALSNETLSSFGGLLLHLLELIAYKLQSALMDEIARNKCSVSEHTVGFVRHVNSAF